MALRVLLQLEVLDELELSIESGLNFAADMMEYGAQGEAVSSPRGGPAESGPVGRRGTFAHRWQALHTFLAPPRALMTSAELHSNTGCVFKISENVMEVRENPIGAAWRMVRGAAPPPLEGTAFPRWTRPSPARAHRICRPF